MAHADDGFLRIEFTDANGTVAAASLALANCLASSVGLI
jgi:hypothetical protein